MLTRFLCICFASASMAAGSASPVLLQASIRLNTAAKTVGPVSSDGSMMRCGDRQFFCLSTKGFSLRLPVSCSAYHQGASWSGPSGVTSVLRLDDSDYVQNNLRSAEPVPPWRTAVWLVSSTTAPNVVAALGGGLGLLALYVAPKGVKLDEVARTGGVAEVARAGAVRYSISDKWIAQCS